MAGGERACFDANDIGCWRRFYTTRTIGQGGVQQEHDRRNLDDRINKKLF